MVKMAGEIHYQLDIILKEKNLKTFAVIKVITTNIPKITTKIFIVFQLLFTKSVKILNQRNM